MGNDMGVSDGSNDSDGTLARFKERCDVIESIIRKHGLTIRTDENGMRVGPEGLFPLQERITLCVDNDAWVWVYLHLFLRECAFENMDYDHFCDIMLERSHPTLLRTKYDNIEYRMRVPAVSSEIFPEVMDATISDSLSFIEYFDVLVDSYRILFSRS